MIEDMGPPSLRANNRKKNVNTPFPAPFFNYPTVRNNGTAKKRKRDLSNDIQPSTSNLSTSNRFPAHFRVLWIAKANFRDFFFNQKLRSLFLLVLARLGLGSTSRLLAPVLALFALLTGRLLNLGCLSESDKAVVGFKFFESLIRVVNQSEASGLATTILCTKTENRDLVFIGLVHLCEPGPEILFGDIGFVGVENIDNHLFPSEKGIANELASSQGNLRVRHGGRC